MRLLQVKVDRGADGRSLLRAMDMAAGDKNELIVEMRTRMAAMEAGMASLRDSVADLRLQVSDLTETTTSQELQLNAQAEDFNYLALQVYHVQQAIIGMRQSNRAMNDRLDVLFPDE